MISIDSTARDIFKWALLLILSVMPALKSASAVYQGVDSCSGGIQLELDSSLNNYGRSTGAPDFYEVDVVVPGMLTFDVTVPAGVAMEPKVAFLGMDCRNSWREGVFLVQRYVQGMVLRIETPGTYAFAVAAQDPWLTLPEYKVRTSFVESVTQSWPALKSVEETEPDPDPHGLTVSDIADKLCRAEESDDHGDTLLCATALPLGSSATAQIDSVWDDDFFSFVLTTQRTVRIETSDGIDTTGVLYDGYGHRLAADGDSGAGSGLRIVRTLGPGRYFVRIAGMSGTEGTYALEATALNW